jgi:hypothetical protein
MIFRLASQASGHSTPHLASRVASSNNLLDSSRSDCGRKPPGLPDKGKVAAVLAAYASNGGRRVSSGSSVPSSPRGAPPLQIGGDLSARSSCSQLQSPHSAPVSGGHGHGQEPGLLHSAITAIDSAINGAVDSASNSEQLNSMLEGARSSMHSAMNHLSARASTGLSVATQHLSRMVDSTSPRGSAGPSKLRKSGSIKDMAALAGEAQHPTACAVACCA